MFPIALPTPFLFPREGGGPGLQAVSFEILGPRFRGGTETLEETPPVATAPHIRHGSGTACTEGPAWPANSSISSSR